MQVSSPQHFSSTLNCYSSSKYAEIDKVEEDFMEKLKIEEPGMEDEEDDFSFPCTISNGSPISAEDAFQNGQIRPIFPTFNRDLLFADTDNSKRTSTISSSLRPPLKKVFVEEPDRTAYLETDELSGVPEGSYCEWSGKAVETSPELCKKSNSTGSSKLWRFRDLGFRSNSDGKDAFVFLNGDKVRKTEKQEKEKVDGKKNSGAGAGKTKGVKGEMASVHERHYAKKGDMKEGIKRRSYLPYRPELVGFFTSVNGMSRNVHPF